VAGAIVNVLLSQENVFFEGYAKSVCEIGIFSSAGFRGVFDLLCIFYGGAVTAFEGV